MLRKITQAVGRYKPGNLHDYPRGVWNKIAQDLGKELDSFSEVVDFNPTLNQLARSSLTQRQSKIRRRGAVH